MGSEVGLELDIGLKMGLGSNKGGHGVEVWVGVGIGEVANLVEVVIGV